MLFSVAKSSTGPTRRGESVFDFARRSAEGFGRAIPLNVAPAPGIAENRRSVGLKIDDPKIPNHNGRHVNEAQRPMRAAFAEERAEGRCSMAKIQLLVRATVTICMRSNQSCMHAV